MDGYEAGTTGALALQHLDSMRASAPPRRARPAGRVRHGVGTGLVRLGGRIAGPTRA